MKETDSIRALKVVSKLRLKFDTELMRGWNEKYATIDYYNYIAPFYDEVYKDEQKEKIDVALRYISLSKESVILDAGCGTGFLFKYLSEKVKLLVGLDTSPGILTKAKKLAKSFSNVHLIRADADFMPFPEGIFDGVFALTLLQNMPNHLWTLNELRRVGKDRSVFVVTAFKKYREYRHFVQTTFVALLDTAGFEVSVIENNEKLKDFIAICKPRAKALKCLHQIIEQCTH
jgi:ubiquinone/menaquinone biosynthesis C-methylase UbiE